MDETHFITICRARELPTFWVTEQLQRSPWNPRSPHQRAGSEPSSTTTLCSSVREPCRHQEQAPPQLSNDRGGSSERGQRAEHGQLRCNDGFRVSVSASMSTSAESSSLAWCPRPANKRQDKSGRAARMGTHSLPCLALLGL